MLQGNTSSSQPLSGVYLSPDDRVITPMIDYELAGQDLLDASQGLMVRVWRCWMDGVDVKVQAEGGEPVVLFSEAGISEIGIAFDQNMRWSAAYLQSGMVKLRWFDALVGQHVVSSFGPGRDVRLCLDDKRTEELGRSDIVLAYIRGTTIYFRQQRDRFLIEYTLKSGLYEGTRLRGIGMNKNLRLQFELVE